MKKRSHCLIFTLSFICNFLLFFFLFFSYLDVLKAKSENSLRWGEPFSPDFYYYGFNLKVSDNIEKGQVTKPSRPSREPSRVRACSMSILSATSQTINLLSPNHYAITWWPTRTVASQCSGYQYCTTSFIKSEIKYFAGSTLRFSVFRGERKDALGTNGLMVVGQTSTKIIHYHKRHNYKQAVG